MRDKALLGFQEPATPRIALSALRALYVGPPLGVGLHRGAVTCFALALDGTLQVTAPERTGPLRSALIGAGLSHEIEVRGTAAAFLYLDPVDALTASLRACMRPIQHRLHVDHPRAAVLAKALAAGGGLEVFPTTAMASLDLRIARVLAKLRRGEWLQADVDEVARAIGVSGSRFMHLFRANVGVPFRRYRHWARLHHAVKHFGTGSTWTTAAVESSFASSSHLTEVFRSMFGVPPTALRGIQFAQADAVKPTLAR